MKTFIQTVRELRISVQGKREPVSRRDVCNYADNYYGDQVCLLKHNK